MAGKVQPVPEGFRTVTPHLVCRDAAAAIEFYKKAFGAEEIMRIIGPDGKFIMHAEFRIGDSMVMLGEESADMQCLSPQSLKGTPVTIHLYVENVDAACQRAVSAGATAAMPVTDMFWGDRYGQVVDPFGHKWSIATHIEDVTPEECAKRAQAWMAGMCGAGAKK